MAPARAPGRRLLSEEEAMPGAVIANWPIALLIIALIVGVPLWLTFRRRHVSPDYRDARTHYQAKASGSAAAQTGEYVPADRVNALDGLTVPHQSRQAADNGPAAHQHASQEQVRTGEDE
jgi:hypothetical protein